MMVPAAPTTTTVREAWGRDIGGAPGARHPPAPEPQEAARTLVCVCVCMCHRCTAAPLRQLRGAHRTHQHHVCGASSPAQRPCRVWPRARHTTHDVPRHNGFVRRARHLALRDAPCPHVSPAPTADKDLASHRPPPPPKHTLSGCGEIARTRPSQAGATHTSWQPLVGRAHA